MIRFFFRICVFFIIILFLFAIIPDKFWQWLKPYFNWEILLKTLKLGWEKFWQFIREITGINFYDFFDKIKDYFGLDIIRIWQSIVYFFANSFEKIANWLR